jgi:hypothetical protein
MLRGFLPLIDAHYDTLTLSAAQIDALAFSVRRNALAPHQQGYKKFAVVRNPFHRLVSVYLDLFDPKSEIFSYHTFCFGILRSDMSFAAFVKTIAVVPQELMGPHFAPQSFILRQAGLSEEGNVSLFRMDKDSALLASFVAGEGFTLSERNRNPTSYDYRRFYDLETFKIAQQLYAQDIKELGYMEEAIELEEMLPVA